MVRIENEKIIIEIKHYGDGESVRQFQKALILGMVEIGDSEAAVDKDHKEAIYFLSEILKAFLLDASQTNVGLGGKPYADLKKNCELEFGIELKLLLHFGCGELFCIAFISIIGRNA